MPDPAAKLKNPSLVRRRTRRPSLAMHTSQCSICRHPERAEIERDFLDWTSPARIARDFDLGSRTTVYRHAHALGLFARRERSLRFALGRFIERVDEVMPTAASIVSAIRLMAKLSDRAKRSGDAERAEIEVPSDSAAAPPAEDNPDKRSLHDPVPDAASEHDGPPVAFAQNVLHRHKPFWR